MVRIPTAERGRNSTARSEVTGKCDDGGRQDGERGGGGDDTMPAARADAGRPVVYQGQQLIGRPRHQVPLRLVDTPDNRLGRPAGWPPVTKCLWNSRPTFSVAPAIPDHHRGRWGSDGTGTRSAGGP